MPLLLCTVGVTSWLWLHGQSCQRAALDGDSVTAGSPASYQGSTEASRACMSRALSAPERVANTQGSRTLCGVPLGSVQCTESPTKRGLRRKTLAFVGCLITNFMVEPHHKVEFTH